MDQLTERTHSTRPTAVPNEMHVNNPGLSLAKRHKRAKG